MADYTQLKADITAAVFENTEQLITGEGLQLVLIEVVDKINMTKQDVIYLGSGLDWNEDGELSVDFTSVQQVFAPQSPLAWDSDGDGLILQLGDGLITTAGGQLTINLGDGLVLDGDTGELGVDYEEVQPIISDLDTIRSGAGAGATALQPTDITTTIDASSTNDQVPGAAAIYQMVGDIETLLASI